MPGRALVDKQLNRSDLIALAAISGRDRFKSNGQGCWEEPKNMADRLEINLKSFYRSIGKLKNLGYLEISPREHDARKKSYSVIFSLEMDGRGIGIPDKILKKALREQEQEQDRLHNCNLSKAMKTKKTNKISDSYDASEVSGIYSDNQNIKEKTLSQEEDKRPNPNIRYTKSQIEKGENWNSFEKTGEEVMRKLMKPKKPI